MRADELACWLHRMPFRPFGFFVLEQTSFEVRHPEAVPVTPSAVRLFQPAGISPLPLGEREVAIALLHITRIDMLAPAPAGNGAT
jgi:hypothetical protein